VAQLADNSLAFSLCYVPQLADNLQIQNLLEQLKQLIKEIFMNSSLLQNIFKKCSCKNLKALTEVS
jgi:hypothetical protein